MRVRAVCLCAGDADIDLFGWGTSGWSSGVNAYKPYETSAVAASGSL